MAEANKDPAIKLFGRTISLTRHNTEASANYDDSSSGPDDHNQDNCYDDDDDHNTPSSPSSSDPREVSYETEKEKEPSRKNHTSLHDDEVSNQTTEDPKSPTSPSNNNNGTQSETSLSQNDKTSPKKPEKILPCPRCTSMDTKFCYFNNYKVNQPRHFCKNCQRYWTAGGTMRNVPVGAGRRKNKNSSNNSSSCSISSFSCASSYHQVMVPEAIQRGGNINNAVLKFGSEPPLCDSIASVLSLAEKIEQNGMKNGFHAPNKQKYTFVAPTSSDKNREHFDSHELVKKDYQCNFPPWPYPWNTAIIMHPPHALYQPGYPVAFYQKLRYYFATPQSCVDHFAPSVGPNSPRLGKHSREGNMLSPISSQKERVETESDKNPGNGAVVIPKTLRIDDDPGEAAMSSVWSTLKIKNDNKAKNISGGGIFKAFSTKGDDDKFHVVEASPVLQANPAALSRSLIFHERT